MFWWSQMILEHSNKKHKGWLAIAKLKTTFIFHFSILTLSNAFLSINDRENKSGCGFSFAMASKLFIKKFKGPGPCKVTTCSVPSLIFIKLSHLWFNVIHLPSTWGMKRIIFNCTSYISNTERHYCAQIGQLFPLWKFLVALVHVHRSLSEPDK